MQAQKSRKTQIMIIQLNGRLDSRKTFKDKDLLEMTSWRVTKLLQTKEDGFRLNVEGLQEQGSNQPGA